MKFDLNVEHFNQRVQRIKNNVQTMQPTLFRAREFIREKTTPLVPLDKGYLERSYRGHILTPYPVYKMMIQYSVYSNPRARVDYALYQHDDVATEAHPKRGEQFYLMKGMKLSTEGVFRIISEDYLSCFKL